MTRRTKHPNLLLRRLSSSDLAVLEPDLEPAPLSFKQTLHEQGNAIKHVYFVTSGVVSVVTLLTEHEEIVETGTIGREGFVGVSALLGAKVAAARALCQVPGDSVRMEIEAFHDAVDRIDRLRGLLMLYTHALLAMTAQSAGCIGVHPVEARMARWLLMTHDRVDGSEFPLTQEFLSQMLGVHRPAVNVAGQALQKAGLIAYMRGRVKILDRAGLEAASCECYEHVRREFVRTLGGEVRATRSA
jgi:CRP-like cAMP-binding protein